MSVETTNIYIRAEQTWNQSISAKKKPVASAGPGQDQATLCGPIQAAACIGQVEVALEVGQS